MLGVTTYAVPPLKLSAPLISPVVQTAPFTTPLYPLPDVSCAIVPDPSSKFQYPMRPCVGGPVDALLTVTATAADVAALPDVSVAIAVKVWLALVAVVVFHDMVYGAHREESP